MEQRERFIHDHRVAPYTMVELCARYGISRKTGYKWLGRFAEAGRQGLQERSRAPHHCPHRISPEVAALICAARRQHPSWGPAKLLAWLAPRHPGVAWPAISTAGDLLARRGLVKQRRRRRHYQHPGVVPPITTQPNDLWTADFKGHFRTRDGLYCYPLTIADQHTRYLLACHGLLSMKGHGVRPVFERLFREYGLPRAIRTDNGVPFATTGIHGLSQLNVWWLRLGIQHQRILPAHPQQNGAHERMHKTLKGEAIRPPRATLALQQRAFNAFRRLFNDERPHQALCGRPPASLFRPSPRVYPAGLPPIEYPGHFIVKRVTNAGTVRFKKRLVFIANALKQHPIGLEEVDDGIWSIYFCRVLLGRIDERDYIIRA
ncbi:MAG TPA: IS481 family transposase [Candidatus Methylomirabilis sp.]|nr:IS481 family transposase [Candidatus Methylomirabilis sp.]